MNYYRLNDDVYLVKGAARSALYDMKTNNLFSISQHTKELIRKTSDHNIAELAKSEEDQSILNALIGCKLLIKSEKSETLKDIHELAVDIHQNFAWIEVTRQCNLSCNFCYESSNPYCIEKMSVDEFKLVADQLYESRITRIQFIGGEPTILKNDLKKMIEYARPFFEFIEVYTNGIVINDSWCEFFKKNRIHIAISIHSYDDEQHDKTTQVKGSHKKIERAQALLAKHNIPHRIGTVLSSQCVVGKPKENTQYRLKPKLPKASGLADFSTFDLEMFRRKAITKESKKKIKINKEFVTKSISGHQCFNKDIYISSTLDVYPCVMERRISYGNIKNKPLSFLIAGSNIRKLNKDHVEGCKDCEYRYACFDCRPDSNGKSLLSKPWFCTYDPSKGIWHDVEAVYTNLKGKSKLQAIPIKVIDSLNTITLTTP